MQPFKLIEDNTNITNYYYFSGLFKDDDITRVLALSKKYTSVEGNVSGKIDHTYRNSTIVWLPVNDETRFLYDKVVEYAKKANAAMWKFNITGIQDNLQVSEYRGSTQQEEAGHYDWHMDVGAPSSTRKLSLSIQLSDEADYDGGDLEFMVHRSIIKAPRTKGTAIFFPSFITHRVTKVTRGTRRSLVFWFHGPPYV